MAAIPDPRPADAPRVSGTSTQDVVPTGVIPTGVIPSGVIPTGERYPLGQAATREAQAMLFFAYRDFTNAADMVLEELGLGRAHHRALHFIGRHPGITVSDLLGILRITKQALARVLNTLVDDGYVAQAPGEADRRQRLLRLTAKGAELEQRLFDRQRDRLAPALAAAGPVASAGFRAVMRAIMDASARDYLDVAYPTSGGKDGGDDG